MSNQRKILIGLHSFNVNGVSKSTLALCQSIKEKHKNISIYVVAPDSGLAKSSFEKIEVRTLSYSDLLDLKRALLDLNFEPEVIIQESFFSPNLKPLAIEYGARFFLRVHEIIPLFEIKKEWFITPKAANEYFRAVAGSDLIFVSEHAKSYYKGLINEFQIKPHVCHPSISENLTLATEEQDPYPRGFRVLQLGTIYNRKGAMETLEAFRLFKEQIKSEEVYLFFIGERNASQIEVEYSKRLRDKVLYHELENNVFVLPSHLEPFSLISDYNVLTLHSRSECFPLVILESLFLGRPVIASSVGGIPEQIETGLNGFLFSLGNIEEQARYFEEVYRAQKQWALRQTKIATSYGKKFGAQQANEELKKIYGL